RGNATLDMAAEDDPRLAALDAFEAENLIKHRVDVLDAGRLHSQHEIIVPCYREAAYDLRQCPQAVEDVLLPALDDTDHHQRLCRIAERIVRKDRSVAGDQPAALQ